MPFVIVCTEEKFAIWERELQPVHDRPKDMLGTEFRPVKAPKVVSLGQLSQVSCTSNVVPVGAYSLGMEPMVTKFGQSVQLNIIQTLPPVTAGKYPILVTPGQLVHVMYTEPNEKLVAIEVAER